LSYGLTIPAIGFVVAIVWGIIVFPISYRYFYTYGLKKEVWPGFSKTLKKTMSQNFGFSATLGIGMSIGLGYSVVYGFGPGIIFGLMASVCIAIGIGISFLVIYIDKKTNLALSRARDRFFKG